MISRALCFREAIVTIMLLLVDYKPTCIQVMHFTPSKHFHQHNNTSVHVQRIYSASRHNCPKQHVSSILLITFFVRKIKVPNLEQVLFTYFLNFHTKILMFSTLRYLTVCFIRVFQFSIFGTVLESTDFNK